MSESSETEEKSLPAGADGDESIVLDNGEYSVDIGETESGTWIWQFDGHSTLYHEYFALQDTNSPEQEVVSSYSAETLTDKELFPDTGTPGEVYSARMEYAVGTNILEVTRSVQLSPDVPALTVTYDVTNKAQLDGANGESSVDLDFFQYADFDDGSNDFTDDIAYYDESETLVYTRDEAGDAYAGFSANKDPINHHVGEYPGYWAVDGDSLNNQDQFPESGSDDPVVAMEWDLGELQIGETGSVTVQFGSETDEDRLKENVREPEPLTSGGVSASFTTLQFIPGRNENATEGGYPLNSGLMQMFPEDESFTLDLTDYVSNPLDLSGIDEVIDLPDSPVDVPDSPIGVPEAAIPDTVEIQNPVGPVLDSWVKGDMTYLDDDVRPGNDELPMKLEDARKKILGKYADEFPNEGHGIYRFENGISISFETTDDETIEKDSIDIEFNESGESNDEMVSLEGRENPITITPDHEVNGIPVEEWYGDRKQSSNRRDRYYHYDTDFEFDGVEGVRVLTISGAYAGFVQDWATRVGNDPIDFFDTVWGWDLPDSIAEYAWLAAPPEVQFLTDYLSVVPNTYSFVDFIVLADGRRYSRVWDASQYPSLATYMDGHRSTIEKMPYMPGELRNWWVLLFLVQASAGATPYHSPLEFYSRIIDDEELREEILTEELNEILDVVPTGWGADEFLPRMPRETMGFHPDGEPIENPDEPFGSSVGIFFPLSGKVRTE